MSVKVQVEAIPVLLVFILAVVVGAVSGEKQCADNAQAPDG